jgi:CrcB protein
MVTRSRLPVARHIVPAPARARDIHMGRFLWICLGGAVGTGARYLLAEWTVRAFGTGFAYGTLAVNVLGSFLIAVVMLLGTEGAALAPTLRMALTIGVLGGFTTFSTFSFETLCAFEKGAVGLGMVNVLANVTGCLLACWAGLCFGRWWLNG